MRHIDWNSDSQNPPGRNLDRISNGLPARGFVNLYCDKNCRCSFKRNSVNGVASLCFGWLYVGHACNKSWRWLDLYWYKDLTTGLDTSIFRNLNFSNFYRSINKINRKWGLSPLLYNDEKKKKLMNLCATGLSFQPNFGLFWLSNDARLVNGPKGNRNGMGVYGQMLHMLPGMRRAVSMVYQWFIK